MNDATVDYEKLLWKLHMLDVEGKMDSPEADQIRAEMDEPYNNLSAEEKAIFSRCSEHLDKATFKVQMNADDELKELFIQLKTDWNIETGGEEKDTAHIVMHPAYQRIIGLGEQAIPLLLKELSDFPDNWHWALTAITGEDPVQEAHAGDLDAMAIDWIRWGRGKGYRIYSLAEICRCQHSYEEHLEFDEAGDELGGACLSCEFEEGESVCPCFILAD